MQRAREGLSSEPLDDAGGREEGWAQHLFKGELEGPSVHRAIYRAGRFHAWAPANDGVPSGARGSPKVGIPCGLGLLRDALGAG